MLLLEFILIILEIVILIMLFFMFKSGDINKIVDCQIQQNPLQNSDKCLKCNMIEKCKIY